MTKGKDSLKLKCTTEGEKKTKEQKKGKGWKIALLIVLCFILLLGVGVVSTFFYFYNRTNYESAPEVITIDEEKLKEMSLETIDPSILESIMNDMTGSDWSFEDPDATWEETQPESGNEPTNPAEESTEVASGEDTSEAETSKEASSEAQSTTQAETTTRDWEKEESEREATRHWSVETATQPTYETVPAGKTSNVLNIVLIGIDETNAGNSDSMILVSINYTRHTITFTSLMRDIGINVPGVGFTRLNCAFAVGGGPLLVATLKANFNMDVNYYAYVSLGAFKQIIETIGGIDLYLTEAEAKYCGLADIAQPGTNEYHLMGYQALQYARDRSSGGNDYGRTQRQRNVIMAIINKVRSGSLGSVVNVVNQCLPYVSHNIPAGTVAQLVANSPSLINYGINQQRIPYDGMYTGSKGYLIPNLTQTKKTWHTFVYGY